VLALQTARFLVRSRQAALEGEPVSGKAAYIADSMWVAVPLYRVLHCYHSLTHTSTHTSTRALTHARSHTRAHTRTCHTRACHTLTLTRAHSVTATVDAMACSATPTLSRLDDLASLVHAFKWRAKQAVCHVTQELASKAAGGLSFDDAWNSCAVELVDAARCVLAPLSWSASVIPFVPLSDSTYTCSVAVSTAFPDPVSCCVLLYCVVSSHLVSSRVVLLSAASTASTSCWSASSTQSAACRTPPTELC
jgi:hypothetical protein